MAPEIKSYKGFDFLLALSRTTHSQESQLASYKDTQAALWKELHGKKVSSLFNTLQATEP